MNGNSVSSNFSVLSGFDVTTDNNNNAHQHDRHKSRINCPCQDFAALSKIVAVLSSEDRTRDLIDWLNGDTDHVAIAEQRLLSCGKRYQCRFRYGTAFAILDAIRDACAPFLVDTSTGIVTSTTCVNSVTQEALSQDEKQPFNPLADYNAQFPPLDTHPGLSNILLPPKGATKNISGQGNLSWGNSGGGSIAATETTTSIHTLPTRKKKSKRRIEPKLTANCVSPTCFGTDDQVMDPDVSAPRVSPTKQAVGDGTTDASCQTYSRVNVFEGVSVSTPTRTSFQLLHTERAQDATPTKLEELPLEQLDRLVKIYVALIRNMLVPSTPIQLILLLQLLDITISVHPR